MKLTLWTDYGLRVLIYCARQAERNTPVTSAEIAAYHNISQHHLNKVVAQLVWLGCLQSHRGRGGGLRLAPGWQSRSLGELIKALEPPGGLAACEQPGDGCRWTGHCGLQSVLADALAAFQAVLDRVTLGELVSDLPTAQDVIPILPMRTIRD